MWRLALAAFPVLALALALAGGVASQTDTPSPTPESSPSPSPSPSPEPTPDATPEPLPPAPPPDPNADQPQPPAIDPNYPGALRPGDWVQITGTDSCLNIRWEPLIPAPQPDGTTYNNVINCLPDGFVGRVDASGWGKVTVPVLAEGRWWWHIVGQGWAAEEWLTLHHQGGIPWPERSDLANGGLIAYIGINNGIWLMRADGSNPRTLVAGDPNQWVHNVQWSPDGGRLAFSLGRTDGTSGTRVVDLNGNVLTEIQGLSESRWSPNGQRLSGVRNSPGGPGGYQVTPVVFDLTTGAEWAIGPAAAAYAGLAWSPDGNSLAFICMSGYAPQPDGTTAIEAGRDCNGDGLRVVSVDGSNPRVLLPTSPQNSGYIYGPSWSPSGGTIAVMSMQQDGCRGYALVDAVSGAVAGCVAPPGVAAFIGGGCGGPGMSAPTWAPSGRLVFFVPGAGQSGFYVHDLNTGGQAFIPNMSAGQASIAPDGANFTFGGGNFIWVAGLDGSGLTLLAEGHSPVWQPQP